MSVCDLRPGDDLIWNGGLQRADLKVWPGDLTAALAVYHQQVSEGPNRIRVNPRNAFLEKEAKGIPFETSRGVLLWAIAMRFPGRPESSAPASASNQPPLPARTSAPPDRPFLAAAGQAADSERGGPKIRGRQLPPASAKGRGRPRLQLQDGTLDDALKETFGTREEALKGLSQRARARLLGVSHQTLMRRVRERASGGSPPMEPVESRRVDVHEGRLS